ncbi:MAG: rod shape-determining protein MreC [Candidatus Saccharimonadales bacterium]|nr:rod shape-determining protein MreC [Candidatus Saccharimonadales bacterium]
MLRRKNSSAIVLGAVVSILVLVYLAFPADPISSTIQDTLFGIDSYGAQTAENTINTATDNRIADLEDENQRLREELNYGLGDTFDTLTAAVVSKSVQNYRSTIDVNVGENEGVEVGQPVLSRGQLVGRVSEVFSTRARVITLTDPDFRAAATINGTKAEGLVRHVAGGVIIEQVSTEDQSANLADQRVVTSGLGGIFPPGLLIGKIGDDISQEGAIFKEFVLTMTASLADLKEVVVLKT